MSILVGKNSKIVIQGITGREASMITRHTLTYGTCIVAGVTPGKGGQEMLGVPVYDTLSVACRSHEINTSVTYVPPAFACDAVAEAIHCGIGLIYIPTEGIPQHDAIQLLNLGRRAGVRIIGPNSVGVISPGERAKLGAIGGDAPQRCFVPGSVGIISRSGGMTAELAWMIKRAGFGVSTAVSIGGDSLIGSTPRDLLRWFQFDSDTKAVVMFGEPGTTFEEDVADLLQAGGFTKPLVCFVAGRFTEELPEETVFGHAASLISGGAGKPSTKLFRLEEAGALVARRLEDIGKLIQQTIGNEN